MTAWLLVALLNTEVEATRYAAVAQAFAQRRADSPVESPDPAIAQCLELIAQDLFDRRARTPEQVNAVVRGFRTAVGSQATTPYDDYRTITANVVTSATGRVAVSVRMGAVSRLALFESQRRTRIGLPAELQWAFQSELKPHFLPDETIVLHAPSITAPSPLRPYRVLWLASAGEGYRVTGRFDGTWASGGNVATLTLNGNALMVNDLDRFWNFTVGPDVMAPRKQVRWVIRNGSPTERTDTPQDLDLRAIDGWMSRAYRTETLTSEQERFLADIPLNPFFRQVTRNSGPSGQGTEIRLVGAPTLRFLVNSTPSGLVVSYVGAID